MSALPSPPPPLRTLQIGNDWPTERVGGLNRYFVDLLRHLPEAGASVRGLVVGSPSIAAETHGVVSAFAQSKDPIYQRLWKARSQALRELRSGSAELVVSHFALYAAPLGTTAGKFPMVVHFHGPWAAESHVEGAAPLSLRLKQRLEQGVYHRAARLIVLSHAFRQELVTRYSVDPSRVHVIPGGIDTQRFNLDLTRSEAREHLGWPLDRPVFLAVRRLVRRMGLENLIDAIKLVRVQHPDVLLLLGGKGPLAAELQTRIETGQLQRNVRLLGRIEEADLPLAYRAADLSIVPTQSLEGFGMITLESLASGTPVLVTPIGGLPEVVQPFAPECVFTDTGTEAMTQTLLEVLDGSRPLPSEMACRSYATQNFAWPVIAKRVCEVYRHALRTT